MVLERKTGLPPQELGMTSVDAGAERLTDLPKVGRPSSRQSPSEPGNLLQSTVVAKAVLGYMPVISSPPHSMKRSNAYGPRRE